MMTATAFTELAAGLQFPEGPWRCPTGPWWSSRSSASG